jgi:hypothetical protein
MAELWEGLPFGASKAPQGKKPLRYWRRIDRLDRY